MILIGQICSFICGKPKRANEANTSEHTVNERTPPTARAFPARLQKKHNSIFSHIARTPSQIAESITSPTSAHSTTPRKSKQKKQWRLSNREVLFDENGAQVFVKEFVLRSPVTPAQQVHDVPHDLSIYAAHMRSPKILQEQRRLTEQHTGQYREVLDDVLKIKQDKQMGDHINPGHDALDLLARMSAHKPDFRSHSEKGRKRRVSLCIPGSKKERAVGCFRPMSLPLHTGLGRTGGNTPNSSSDMLNATAQVIPGRTHGNNETIQRSSSNHTPFELDSAHVSPTLQSSPSSDTSTYTSPLSSPSNDPQTSPSSPNEAFHTRTSDSWTLPTVFERLYEDAERRQKQQQGYHLHYHHMHPTPQACCTTSTVVTLPQVSAEEDP